MAYVPLDPADIVAGKPTKEEIFQQIKDNQDNFNSEIALLQGTASFSVFDSNFVGAMTEYTLAYVNTRCPVYKSPAAGTIRSVVMTLLEPSTSGILELDVQKSTDNGANWSSILTTAVQLTGTTTGSLSGSVSFSDASVAQNDLLRIQFIGLQINQGDFHVSVYGDRS